MLQCSNPRGIPNGNGRQGSGHHGSRQRYRTGRRDGIGAPQRARFGARRRRREHRSRRRRSQCGRRPEGRLSLPGRHDRRSVSRVGVRFHQQRVRHGHDVRAGRRHHARRPRGAHRQGDGQGTHLSGGPVQTGHRREPRRARLLGARDDRAHRRESRRLRSQALGSVRGNAGSHRVHRLRFLAGQPRPDLLRQHQGRARRRGGDDHEGSRLLRRALRRDSPGIHRHADGARAGRRLHQQEHPAVHAIEPAHPSRRDRRCDLLHARPIRP